MAEPSANFFSRWSQRKLQPREDQAAQPEAATLPAVPAAPAAEVDAPAAAVSPAVAPAPATPPAAATAPAPTLEDVAALSQTSDYTRFVGREVQPEVRNAALRKLFTDPHYNVMDGLDIYIDDYGKPDPLPEGMLRQMVQSQLLGLFKDEEAKPEHAAADAADVVPADPTPTPPASPPGTEEPAAHEDLDLQLQPDPAAGPVGAGAGAVQDPGRQH